MKRVLIFVTALLCLLMPASAVYAAYNPLENACKSGGGTAGSTACTSDGTDPISGKNGILKKASLVLAILGGVAAIIIIIIGGFRYVTSAGDANKAASARNAIVGAIVGVVIIAAAEVIVIFVVSRIAKG
jgi:hypothetical protein